MRKLQTRGPFVLITSSFLPFPPTRLLTGGTQNNQVIPEEIVQALFSACKSGNFDLADKEVNNIIADGYPVSQMLSQLFDVIVGVDDISDEQKARICKKLGEADKRLVDGADEYLQLLDVASNTMRALCNMPEELSYEN
ncbi:unnamed protein product [Ilex paraguariensis]|uniref:Replication factor C C-terminal domain-containing protein n=1 Tax=Ilex paraguariensis TaxID=185542 RepID=A0ABC8TN00_9AQUA